MIFQNSHTNKHVARVYFYFIFFPVADLNIDGTTVTFALAEGSDCGTIGG